MSNEDRDIDTLLRRNAEQQLAGFDWDRQRQTVMQRLATPQRQKPRRVIVIRIAAGVAAVLTLVAGYMGMSLLKGPDRNIGVPMEMTVRRESVGGDALLASTDPTMILLTGSARWLVLNDPMLTPHSPWDQ